MARPDSSLPRDGSPGDEPDIPLNSIPSVPDEPLTEPMPSGSSSNLVAGGALLFLIVAASLLGARYLKTPHDVSVAAPEEHRLGNEVGQAPAPTVAPPAVPPVTAAAPPLPRPEVSSELTRLRSDLAARDSELREARSRLDSERGLRRDLEHKLETARANAARADADASPSDRRGRRDPRGAKETKHEKARAKDLEKKVAALEKKLAAAEHATAAARAEGSAHDSRLGELTASLESSRKAAEQADARTREIEARQNDALKGEGEAVRKLVADLAAARDKVASEHKARLDAEQKLRALRAEAERASREPREETTLTRPAPAGVRASAPPPPLASRATEPDRVKTVPPRYPEELRRRGVQGRVQLRMLVDESGTVADVQVVGNPDPAFAAAATEAARRWEYNPGRKDGLRTRMWVNESVDFKL